MTEEVKLDKTIKSSFKALSTSSVIHKQNVSYSGVYDFPSDTTNIVAFRLRPRTALVAPVSVQQDRPYMPRSVMH